MKETILGIDLGTTSVGFSLVELDDEKNNGKILHMGSRIFPEGYKETPSEIAPRNKRRREKRLLRRQLRRRKLRKVTLSRRFAEVGLLPKFGSAEWEALMNTDPYQIRAKGIDEALEKNELGRALYHLVQRRGFKSSRKSIEEVSQEGDEDRGVVKERIKKLSSKMKGRTLGQFLNTIEGKKRGDYLGREMIQEEFEKLWDAQVPHHPALLNEELKKEIKGIAFRQRPTFWRLGTLGKCLLEPKEPLCLKGSWLAQQFLMLQDLNSLRLSESDEPLPKDQRNLIIESLNEKGSLTWPKLRELLKSSWKASGTPLKSKFNLEVGKVKDKLPGNLVEAKLSGLFGKFWTNHPSIDKLRNEIPQDLWNINYEKIGEKKVIIRTDLSSEKQIETFLKEAPKKYQINLKQAEALTELVLPQGWLAHSSKAIEKLMPYLEKGLVYAKAKKEVYPDSPEGKNLDELPSHQSYLEHIRNPAVKRTLNELRKVVNNLVRSYGKPDKVRIELARDLKKPGALRREIQRNNKVREKERNAAKQDLEQNGILNPDRDTVEKWLLWEECERRCPYTDREIGFDELFKKGLFHVEHIIPFSESLDNRFINKTLCWGAFNVHKKKNQIPFGAYDKEEWKEFIGRVKKSKLHPAKKSRLTARKIEDVLGDDFSERQLRDTAYIANEARDFLMLLFKKEEGKAIPVEATNGMITAHLRGLWKLHHLLETRKKREDHRHHAIDALVVSMVSPGVAKKMNDFSKYFMKGSTDHFPLPWIAFKGDAAEALDKVVVSHKVRSKLNGKLHDETFYKRTKLTKKTGKEHRVFYSKRIELSADVSTAMLKKLKEGSDEFMFDEGGRNLKVIQTYLKKNGDFKNGLPKFKLPDGSWREIKHVNIIKAMKPELMTDMGDQNMISSPKDENHHMVIFQTPEEKLGFSVVSRFDAAKRHSNKQPIILRDDPNKPFVASICIGDTLEIRDDENDPEKTRMVVVESIWEAGTLVIRNLTDASKNKPEWKTGTRLFELGAQKVSVDPIGRIFPKND